ncbi:unnamed protein product, partial [Ixodes hexagonus]
SDNGYTCFNKNHQNVTSVIRSFNRALAARLIASNYQPKLRYEDDDAWTEVLPDVFVYSAFLEKTRSGTWQIRSVGIVRRDLAAIRQTPVDIQCLIDAGTVIDLAKVELTLIADSHNRAYTAAFFTCPVELPSQVKASRRVSFAIRLRLNVTRPKWVKIHKTGKTSVKLCSVCVKPIYDKFNELSLITEFIGYYTSMGVSRFDLYISDVSRGTQLLLSRLRGHSGTLIKLHRWNLKVDKAYIWYKGQLAAIQDCIYRSWSFSEYVIIVDFDEFLVPKKKRTILEALLVIESRTGKNLLGSMVVQNQFFCTEYPYNSALLRQKPPLLSQITSAREATPWKHYARSKYIMRPNATIAGGVHYVLEHHPGVQELLIPMDEMVLHHYRTCCGLLKRTDAWLGSSSHEVLQNEKVEVDKSMYAFSTNLVRSDAVLFVKRLLQRPVTRTL